VDPTTLKFTKTLEWVALDGDVATIGISDFAVKELTDVVHLELPPAGRSVSAGEEIGEIESVKAVSDLYAPLAGEIVEVNQALANDLAPLSEDPYGAGWIVRLRVADPAEVEALLDYAAYQAACQSH
jgi:glycine cleavage system H protein